MCQENSHKLVLKEPRTVWKVVYFLGGGPHPIYKSIYRDFVYPIGKTVFAENTYCYKDTINACGCDFDIGSGFLHFFQKYEDAKIFLESQAERWKILGVPGNLYGHDKITLTILECELDRGDEVFDGIFRYGIQEIMRKPLSTCAFKATVKSEFKIARTCV